MKTIPCPGCGNKMNIAKLYCTDCDITIKGTFHSHRFGYLDKETLDFIETFVLTRGNIKDIEKNLGISYPTVRSRIDKMVEEVEKIKNQDNPAKIT